MPRAAGATHASFVLAGAVLRGPGSLPRARSGHGKRWQTRHTCLLAGAVLGGPGPLPRARSGRGKRWQARHMRRLCWQARYLEALDRCRARARAAGNSDRRDTRVVCAGRRGTERPWTLAARALGPRETLAGATHTSFALAGAVLRGPGPLPRARSGRGKRWQTRHTCRFCWQARYLEALDPCRARARAAGNAGRRDTRVVSAGRRGTWRPWTIAARALGPRETLAGATHASFLLAGAVLRGPGPLPRARSGRGKRWQARHTCRLCWQARYLEALDLCRARARAAGNAGRRDTRVVCAGRRG